MIFGLIFSEILGTISTFILCFLRNSAVPLVAINSNPSSTNSFAIGTIKGLSLSFTEINTFPCNGSFIPAAICALA